MSVAFFESLDGRVLFSGGISIPAGSLLTPPIATGTANGQKAITAGRAGTDDKHRLTVTLLDATRVDVSLRGARVRVAIAASESSEGLIKYFTKVKAINVEGSAGADQIVLGSSLPRTTVHGGDGNDAIGALGSGSRTIYGGAGNDRLTAGDGGDSLYGEDGNDRLYGGAGDDLLDGGLGKDYLIGRGGKDELRGGTGIDRIVTSSMDQIVGDKKDRVSVVD